MQIFNLNESVVGGPSKVSRSIKAGLDMIGVDYVTNPARFNSEKRTLFTQMHPKMLHVKDFSKVIIGPNVCVLPDEQAMVMEQKYYKIILS